MSQEKVAAGHRYVRELFEAKPERARATATSTVTLRDGLACEIVEGPWRLAADMSEKAGGTGAAPTPGVLGRAALGSCIAISFMYEASNAGVDVAGVQVEVQTDFDDGGMFGTSDAPPGYLEVRYELRVESEAPDEELARVAAAAAERTPYLDVFGRAQTLTPSLRVVRSGTPTAEAP